MESDTENYHFQEQAGAGAVAQLVDFVCHVQDPGFKPQNQIKQACATYLQFQYLKGGGWKIRKFLLSGEF